MTAGRPRTTSFSPEEMIKLGEEMVAWVQEHKPIHIKQWYCVEKGFIYNEWKSFIQLKEFLPYYELAMHLVGLNYINGTINPSIAHRFIRVYFKDVKEEEDDTAKYQASLKQDSGENVPDDIVKGLEDVLNTMKSRQMSHVKINVSE